MVDRIRKRFSVIFLLSAIIFFYAPFLYSVIRFDLRVPLPADTIVGLYSPYRDFYANLYPNGIPFKNFLITDPVRQTYVWKELVVDQWRNFHVPSWNPYEMTGKPLAGNLQSSPFYLLNLLFLIPSFPFAWSVFIISQSVMAGMFTYFYLRNLKLNTSAASLGAASFTFSGFAISWLEWGSILHTAVWLPLILLAIDQLFGDKGTLNVVHKKRIKRSTLWIAVTALLLSVSFFGGHLQTFFYLSVVGAGYFLMRWVQYGKKIEIVTNLFLALLAFLLITAVQWIPTVRFILLSARDIDQNFKLIEGWFLPYRHLIQFLVPDFFGNPATLNYWGTWNYGELTGYIGIVPFVFALYSLFRRNSTILFFAAAILVSLVLALPNFISNIPYVLSIPVISSAQPTRLLFLVMFSLSILSAYGASFVFKHDKFHFRMLLPVGLILLLFAVLWTAVELPFYGLFEETKNLFVSKRNMIFPTVILAVSLILFIGMFLSKKRVTRELIMILLLLVTFLDLLRFSQKFTPFVRAEYIFPQTKIIEYLQKDKSVYRVAVTDRRIMPPNFFTHYRIQTIEGYDPLYLRSYAEYIVALERNTADISQPYGFNRIITPHNYNSVLFNFLNPKYILSFDEINQPEYVQVLQEGQTRLYENKKAYERAYFVENVVRTKNTLAEIFLHDLQKTAVVDLDENIPDGELRVGKAEIEEYNDNSIRISTVNDGNGFLVISDAFYPTWSVFIDGQKTQITKVNHSFRGVYVPSGNHTILFKDRLF